VAEDLLDNKINLCIILREYSVYEAVDAQIKETASGAKKQKQGGKKRDGTL
jgi:hypothetical protein